MCVVITGAWVLSFWVRIEYRLAFQWLNPKTIHGRIICLHDGCIQSTYFERTEILPPVPRWNVFPTNTPDFWRYRRRTYGFVWPQT